MQKGSFLIFFGFVLIGMIGFVSAQYYGGYGYGSFGYFNLDDSTVLLGIIFLVSFGLLYYPLSRFFRDNTIIAAVITFALSFGITWWVYRSGITYDLYFYNLFSFLPSDFLATILPLVFLALVALMIWKLKFSRTLLIIGGFLVILSLTEFVVDGKGIIFTVGLILAGVGIWMMSRKRRGNNPNNSSSRIDILISEAKAYRHWADKTDNPKFYRSWAGYLGYLKNRGYGSGEKEICRRLNVTSRDILNVVKRHIR